MKLLAKGYLLIAFPLVCHIIFVAVLGAQLWQLRADLIAAQRAHEIGGRTQHFLNETVPVVAQLDWDADLIMQRTALRKRAANVEMLAQLTAGSPEHRSVENLLALVRSQSSMLDWMAVQQHQGWTRSAMAELGQKVWEETHKLIAAMNTVIAAEQSTTVSHPDRVKPLETSVMYTLIGGLAVSIFVSIILALYYAFTIRKPLMHLIINGKRLADRQELEPQLSGADELSTLDHLFHTVSAAIDHAIAKERDLFLNATDLICSLNPQGIFTRVNPYAQEMLDIEADDLIGTSIIDLVAAEDCQIVDQWLSHMANAGGNEIVELRLRKKDGDILTQWSSFFSQLDANVFCVVHDITEMRRLEQLKEDFMNMVAHDLRSPLTSLFGSMKLISGGALGALSESALDEVMRSERNIEKVIHFVNDLLDFQKLQYGKLTISPKEHDLRDVVTDAMGMVHGVSEAQGVSIHYSGGSFTANFDSERLLQVVMNLLGNAIKFSPANQKATVDVIVKDNGDSLRLSVRDHGPGVPEAVQQSIFEPFVQLPGAQMSQGTGLGLAICKLIVEAHGGELGVRNATGGGAEFWMQIPK